MSASQDTPEASEPDMAGWLWRKWKRGGMRRKWVREYVVLRGSFLYTYASEEQKKQQQLLPVKDATTQIYVHHKRLFTFEIVHDERRGVCFDAPSDEEKYEWIRLIARAAVGPVNAPKTINTYYEVLNLRKESGQDVTENEVRKAYRKLALRHHPDKGGDIALFQRITEAYEILCALAEQAAEEAEDFVQVRASLRRGGDGGMGCSLKGTGKPPLARISVKAVKPDSQAEAAGLTEGDIIIEVDGRGVRGLPFQDTLKYMQGIRGGPELLELLCLRSKAEAIAPPSRSPPPVPEASNPTTEPEPNPEADTASTAKRPARPAPNVPSDAGNDDDSAGASKSNATEADQANVADGASSPQSGWLMRKWKSGGFRRRWEKCFFVVQDGYLVSYNSSDTVSAKPTGLMPLKDATTQLFKHHSREHTFEVLHEERRPVCFACADDEDLHSWVKAVATASFGPANPPAGRSVADLCGVLGINELDSADLDVVRAAFRECALHNHPEKGGDGAKWEAITEAYEVLVALRETEFQELEEYNAIKVTLDRPPAGGSLGMHLVPTGKAPICRVSVKILVEGTVAQTCGLIEPGDIIVEVDDVSVRGVAFEEVTRRMRGAGARRVLIKLLRRKPAAQLRSPSHGANMLPAPAQNAAPRGRKASFMQAVNAEMAGKGVAPADGAAAGMTTSGGRRKMSWLQRVEQQKASVTPGLSSVTEAAEDEDESDESDEDHVDEQAADTEDDESADAAMPLRATPSQHAVSESGRRKMSFLQQVENEVRTGTVASASVPAAAPLAPVTGAATGRRKASWLVRAASEQSAPASSRKTSWLHKSAAAEPSSKVEGSTTVVFEELLDDDDAVGGSEGGSSTLTAASATHAGLRKGSWLPQATSTVSKAQPIITGTAPALSSIDESGDDKTDGDGDDENSDEDSDDSGQGVDAEEANAALNRLASMHGIPQRASWVDVPTQPSPQPLQQLPQQQQQQQNASTSKKPKRNLRINADTETGADPFPSLGTPSPSVGNASPWSEEKSEASELSWRLLWSRRFRLLYILCRINSRGVQTAAAQASATLETIRTVLNNLEDACSTADGAPICAALHSQKVTLWRDAKLRRSGAANGPLGADGNEFAAALVHIDEPFAESRPEHAGLVHDVVPPNTHDVVRLRSGDGPSRVRFTAEMQRMIGAQPEKPTLEFLQRCRQLGLLIDLFCVQHGM